MVDSMRVQKCASESPEKLIDSEYIGINKISSKSLNGSCKSLRDNAACLESNNDAEMNDEICEFDGLSYKDTKNFANTIRMLDVLRKNRQLCDLILQLDDDSQDIYCHQVILACNSKFFMEIFTNYELEHQDSAASNGSSLSNSGNGPATLSSTADVNMRKKSLVELTNRNKNTAHTQLLFCLSDYLRNFLRDNHHHHYAKLNSILNHNSHYHHHHHHHPNNLNYNVDSLATTNNEELNHNLDYEALKLCIDFMYSGKLKVPSYLIPHVYTLAYHLSFENIVQVCAQYLTDHLNVDNCLGIRSFALDEKLIEASSQCIEKNIEYILQLNPKCLNSSARNNKLSASLNSLSTSKNGGGKLTNGTAAVESSLENSSSLSCSINLAHNEFNHLPRINIELVGLGKSKLPNNLADLTQLCMKWLVDVVQCRKNHNLNDLCDNLNMLYMNGNDHMLHDCCEMETTNVNFNDYIDDYQKKHNADTNENLNKQHNRDSLQNESPPHPTLTTQTSLKIKAFKITDQDMNDIGKATPIKLKTLHENELICTYQVSPNSFVAICTLTGKLISLSVNLLKNGGCENNTNGSNEVFPSPTITNGGLEWGLASPNELKTPDSDQIMADSYYSHQHLKSNNSDTDSPTALDADIINKNRIDGAARLSKMLVSRCSHGLISYKNKLYIIGGYDRGECLSICECYDPKTNTTTEMRSMENRRGRAAITWLESEKSIYVMGGSDGHMDLNSIERFDMETSKWSTIKLDFDLTFTNLGAIACRNFIYLVGLKQDGIKTQSRTCCLKFEPKTGMFTRLAELNHSRSQCALVWTYANAITNRSDYFIYVFGGYDQIKCLNSCEMYNVQDDKWTVIAGMYEPRRGCGAAFHEKSQSVYIVGGTNGSKSLKSVEIYDLVAKKWTTGPELNYARTNVSIAFIGDMLFATGGFDGKSFMRTIEYLNCNDLNNGWSLFHKTSDFDFI